MFSMVSKLKSLKLLLKDLNKKQGHIIRKVDILRKEVEILYSALDCDPHNSEIRDLEVVFSTTFKEAFLD
ncbi:hypothetical protein Pint_16141 [Pistacia integerrima]|uniref:Uncharacterized protein n=1 Tax=Pistacia integerrima TaxID=434235 RepID=A0ACC0ZCT5_9ROSI|nr:hypothetical protein Pint_16141 [Pistacia integerrima]